MTLHFIRNVALLCKKKNLFCWKYIGIFTNVHYNNVFDTLDSIGIKIYKKKIIKMFVLLLLLDDYGIINLG